jgi:uptake hydrogenase large subunit
LKKIEGEATVDFELKDEKVEFATISFKHLRGMEKILQNRSALDALVITPRTCGICGHSHLIATARALESALKSVDNSFLISEKAKKIREITIMLELLQNHFKWFYLIIYPEISKLANRDFHTNATLKGAFVASIINKISALFCGQWPHSSYAIVGGVTSDPTSYDLTRALSLVNEVTYFFEKEFAGVSLDNFLNVKKLQRYKRDK